MTKEEKNKLIKEYDRYMQQMQQILLNHSGVSLPPEHVVFQDDPAQFRDDLGPKKCSCPPGTNHFNRPLVDGKCAKCGGV